MLRALLTIALGLLALGGARLVAAEGPSLMDLSLRFMRPDDYQLPYVAKEVSDNTPGTAGRLSLVARPDKGVRFGDGYRGMRLFVVNRGPEPLSFLSEEGRLKLLVQEALDERGEWKPIEAQFSLRSFCGNSLWGFRLQPGQYWELAAPRYTGSFKTRLRFRLLGTSAPGGVVYSEEFEGSVNPEQFRPPEGPAPRQVEKP